VLRRKDKPAPQQRAPHPLELKKIRPLPTPATSFIATSRPVTRGRKEDRGGEPQNSAASRVLTFLHWNHRDGRFRENEKTTRPCDQTISAPRAMPLRCRSQAPRIEKDATDASVVSRSRGLIRRRGPEGLQIESRVPTATTVTGSESIREQE